MSTPYKHNAQPPSALSPFPSRLCANVFGRTRSHSLPYPAATAAADPSPYGAPPLPFFSFHLRPSPPFPSLSRFSFLVNSYLPVPVPRQLCPLWTTLSAAARR
ncbi:hypothetical protein DFH09DRAFT_1340009 [Mycena vulgaris]|nr:hypothetical protein DFH09DRAFT_1340009 [Mycena vulgaris]